MTTKQKELRKERVKDILLKTLHVICYILSFLFILVCIVGGVKSCENKTQSVSAEEDKVLPIRKRLDLDLTQYNVYVLKTFNNGFEIPLAQQRKFLEDSGIDIDIPSSFYRAEQTYGVYLPNDSYVSFGNDFYELKSIDYVCHDFQYPNNTYYRYLINSIRIISRFDGVYHLNELVHKADSSAISYTYNITNNVDFKIITIEDLSDDYFVNFFYKLSEPSNFIFNKQFNYNAPLGTNVQGLYGSMTFDTSGANIRWKNYNVGYFISNGQLFNQIQYNCVSSDGTSLLYGDGQVLDAPSGYWVYGWISYVNTDTNDLVVVNRHDQVPFQHNGGTSLYYANSSTWTNDQFRYITFLNPLDDSLSITINSFNNNNQNFYSGQIYTEGGDVFTLLSYGFSSLSDFWSINILPGISIGVLFFLPAVVGIIITIVHLLRK